MTCLNLVKQSAGFSNVIREPGKLKRTAPVAVRY